MIAIRKHWTPAQIRKLRREVRDLEAQRDRNRLVPLPDSLIAKLQAEADGKTALADYLEAHDGDATAWPGVG